MILNEVKERSRFFRFALVGALGTMIDFGVMNLLSQFANLPLVYAGTLSFICAISSNFVLNRVWTYPESRSLPLFRQIGIFFLVNLWVIVIRIPIFFYLEQLFLRFFNETWYLTSETAGFYARNSTLVVAIGIVVLWNFFVNSYWTYNDNVGSPIKDVQNIGQYTTPKRNVLDEISFTAMYPKEGAVEKWHTLLVYTHLLSATGEVRKDLKRFHDQLPNPKEVRASVTTQIARGTEIVVIPSCSGITFNPEKVSFRWLEDYHREEFRFRIDNSLINDATNGQINFYVGPIIVGTLKLAMLVNDTETSELVNNEEHGRMYHQDDIFVSYSHKDSPVVLACKRAYQALGFNVLIDIDTLRSGQVWDEELKKMIKRANIFQLFWSQNSSESEYCKSEWQYALKCKKQEGYIRPVYWKLPMPTPPPELDHIHFDYIELANNEE